MIFPGLYNNPNAVISLHVQGSASFCGCASDCGCTPNVPKISPQYDVPFEARSYLSLSELEEFVRNINFILENNYLPPLPVIFMHFCIPFSPICLLSYYSNRCSNRIDKYLESVNQEKFVSRGCHW
jgi:hypothetical protein